MVGCQKDSEQGVAPEAAARCPPVVPVALPPHLSAFPFRLLADLFPHPTNPITDNSTHDLARLAQGSFQGWNDTTACPESDAYSDQPYTCEWWAPNCHFCDFNATLAAEPLAITCEGYRPAGPVKASLPKKVV